MFCGRGVLNSDCRSEAALRFTSRKRVICDDRLDDCTSLLVGYFSRGMSDVGCREVLYCMYNVIT